MQIYEGVGHLVCLDNDWHKSEPNDTMMIGNHQFGQYLHIILS